MLRVQFFDDGVQRGIGCRKHKGEIAVHPMHARHCLEERSAQVADFRLPAAGQHRHDALAFRQTQFHARACHVGHHRNHICQWMTHVRRGNTGLGVDFRLEREQAEDVVHRPRNRADTTAAPRPDRWTDKVHNGNSRAPQRNFETEIEIRRIHANKTQRRTGQQLITNRATSGQNLSQRSKNFDIAVDGQRLHRPMRNEPLRHHAASANSGVVHRFA